MAPAKQQIEYGSNLCTRGGAHKLDPRKKWLYSILHVCWSQLHLADEQSLVRVMRLQQAQALGEKEKIGDHLSR